MNQEKAIALSFDSGTIIVDHLQGEPLELLKSLLSYDERVRTYRALAMNYAKIVMALHRAKIPFVDAAKAYEKQSFSMKSGMIPREHQNAAFEAWRKVNSRGMVVLPTGAGKSFLAYMGIQYCQRPSLIMVPTIDLMHQWNRGLSETFGIEVGMLGGGEKNIQPITVSTYDSALLMMEWLGDRFGLLVFDECHHLPGDRMRQAALMSLAPFRLGLTATPERSHTGLSEYGGLTGPLCFRMEIGELKGDILSPYETCRIELDLDEDEEFLYHEERQIYLDFLKLCGISFKNGDGWARFIMACARSDEGRRALKAFYAQKKIANCGRAKFRQLWQIFRDHSGERIIIFTADNDTAYAIGRRFLLPVLTHHTKSAERKKMLDRFRSGQHPILATSKVLNEGVDVPEASVGIVVSGSGSTREHVQRLGRILRKSEGKQAVLYELISRNTSEFNVSERRRQHSAYEGSR
ncbi:DEAD/DEAH box helicase family protein [Lentisphaera profundi]|uniref:DNA 3'-5' helicase n=1 Tax=Lentisphaera profundi TaxID=1658616 RepID=A0ABY7VX47_9BACT|nr:DEAD/DEAH box helicase family protein [Lentisphaera profundi]WDE98491.1 DEAD/DEAH box helicase family protein [Lentisphaera profundi]